MRRWIVAGATDHSTPRLRISSRIDRSRNTRKKAAAYRISCTDTRQQLFPLSDRPKFRALIVENVKCTLIPAAIFRTIIHVYIYIYTHRIYNACFLSLLRRIELTKRTKTSTGICAGAFESPTTDITYTVAVLHARTTQKDSLRGSVAKRR